MKNIIILIKLLKNNILFYIAIYVFKQFSFILLSMFSNSTKIYFNFNNIDCYYGNVINDMMYC